MCAPYLIAQLDDTRNAFSHFGFSLFIVCLVVYLLFWLYVYSRSRSTIEARSKKEEKKIFDWMKLNIQSTTCLSTSNSMNIKPYAWITPRWALVALQVDRCVTRADKLLRSVFIYIVSNSFFLFSIFSKFFFLRPCSFTNFRFSKDRDGNRNRETDRKIWISISVWIIANSKSCR